MTPGHRLAEAAYLLIDAPFRLHGRDPNTGLDCVGLVMVSLHRIGVTVDSPVGYQLRNLNISQWLPHAERSGLRVAQGPILPGDVLLMAPGPLQHHLMIAYDSRSVVQAHAGLRRVVHQPLEKHIEPARRWRLHN